MLAVLMASSLVAGLGPIGVAADDTVAIDDDHGLTSESAIDEFNETGVAETTETYPDVTMTVAEDSESVGLEGIQYTDFDSVFLQVDYDESIDRTLRVYIPEAYWHPHPDELEAVDADVTASLEPTGDGYTAVTMHVEDETTATFEVKKQASLVFNARETTTSWLENETGMDLPRLDGSSDQWEYVPTAELTDNDSTVGIDTEGEDVTLQYDAANTADPNEQAWRTLPACTSSAGDSAPVCHFDRADDPDHVYILAQTDDPPDVRYHYDAGFTADIRSSVGELGDIVDAVLEDARSFIDGVFD
ncbi:hypothetical protein C446_02477 [Halobiforma nitratireducens JCM 10879]|uniref:Uncharacterized protein n=1 Tax=Halobiforma nitratireducens JCM 10879 TaxID=1227454 RepID=M0MLA8_9EURY|nr:hypothetical protein C446_02477 [Halobiforma nitratireducens JCM 10879]